MMKTTTTRDRSMSFVRALLYGDSGIGKTTSLKTLPTDKTVIAAAERGLLPLAGLDFQVLTIETWNDVREVARQFSGKTPYEINDKQAMILAIDSLSEISDFCKRHILEIDRKKLMEERTKGARKTPPGIYDDLMTMEDWGLYRTRMTNMLSAFCHLPLNIVFTCLGGLTEDKQTGSMFRAPNLNGKLATECPAQFDLVLHMESTDEVDDEGNKKNIRVWRTFHDGKVIAKDASGKLASFEPTDWTKLLTKILSAKRSKSK